MGRPCGVTITAVLAAAAAADGKLFGITTVGGVLVEGKAGLTKIGATAVGAGARLKLPCTEGSTYTV